MFGVVEEFANISSLIVYWRVGVSHENGVIALQL